MKQELVSTSKTYTLFPWSIQKNLNPINVKKADGVYFYDYDGRRYLDFSSQLMNVNIGHNHPLVKKAIKEQLEEVSYIYPGMITEPRAKLGKKLAQITPGNLIKTFFTNGGADAIENAIKIARVYTGKQKIITKYRSYHGATYGAMSASGDPRRLLADNTMSGIVRVEDPYCYRCPWQQKLNNCQYECIAHVERIINFEGPDTIAAILMEGESGSSGCIKYPPLYWSKIKDLANKYNILIIADEVMSGFGRCGKWFAIQNFNVIPDIMTMAKGLTSGYIPLGGVILSDKIANYFDDHVFISGLTYSAHPLACAAALACIQVYENEGLIQNALVMGKYIHQEVEKLRNQHPSIGDFRSTGLLGCIELVKNRDTKEPLVPFNAKGENLKLTNMIAVKIKELGMFTFVRWNWIFIAPPLNITKSQIDEGLAIISEAITIADQNYH